MSAFEGKADIVGRAAMSANDPPREFSQHMLSEVPASIVIGRGVRKEVVRKEGDRTAVLVPATAVVSRAWACVQGQQWVVAEETLGQSSQGFAG
jgi:hypothetical protein